jgi:transposase
MGPPPACRPLSEVLAAGSTRAGQLRKIPKLRRQTLETAIIERYRRRESAVEEALQIARAGATADRRLRRPPAEACLGFRDLSDKRLLREIRDLSYAGGYTVVTDFLRDVRPPRRAEFERRFETPPGRQRQVDFAEVKVDFDEEPAAVRKVWLFSLVLGHSGWLCGRFCAGQHLETVLRCQIDAFATAGGATSELRCDRMETAVIGGSASGWGSRAPGVRCAAAGRASACAARATSAARRAGRLGCRRGDRWTRR